MAFTFDTTIKGSTTNSYLTVSEAQDYADGHQYGSEWTAILADQQRYLVAASDRLDEELFNGNKTTDTQSLQFPRQNLLDRAGTSYLDEDVYPREFKRACFELALSFARTFSVDTTEAELLESKSESLDGLGSVSQTFRNIKADRLPEKVSSLLIAMSPEAWVAGQPLKLVR